MKKYRNSIGSLLDDLIYTKQEKEQAAILNKLAESSAKNSKWIYIIPVAGLAIFGILAVIVLKKKQQAS